jgi:hypothetical protein
MCNIKRKLKNPVHKFTGKPLKPSTVKSYQRDLADRRQWMKEDRLAIRMLVNHGLIGNRGPRWDQGKVIALHQHIIERERERYFERKEKEIEAEHPELIAHMDRIVKRGRERGFSSIGEMADHFEELWDEIL